MTPSNNDIERAFSEDHGGVADELEEAGDMSRGDGLGSDPESGPLGADHDTVKVEVVKVAQLRMTKGEGAHLRDMARRAEEGECLTDTDTHFLRALSGTVATAFAQTR